VKPLALAALMAETARSNTPFCDTALSWWSFKPSRCTEKNRYGEGSNKWSFFSNSRRVVQRDTNFFRATSSTDDFRRFLVDQRLSARNRHHRRAAFLGGIPAFLRRHPAMRIASG